MDVPLSRILNIHEDTWYPFGLTVKLQTLAHVDCLFTDKCMEDGGVYTTVIESRQHKMGWMADFPPLSDSSVFYFLKHYVPQIKSQTMGHALVNLFNTILFWKYVDS